MMRHRRVSFLLLGWLGLGCAGGGDTRTTRTVTLNLADFSQAPAARFQLQAAAVTATTKWCADVSGGADTPVVKGCAPKDEPLTLELAAAECVEAAVDANADEITDARARQCDGSDQLDVAVFATNDDPNWVPPLIEASPQVVRAGETVTASFSGTFTAPVAVQLRLHLHRDGSWPYWRSATETVKGEAARSFTFKPGEDWPATNAASGAAYYFVLQAGERLVGGPAIVILTDPGAGEPAQDRPTGVAMTLNGGATLATEPVVAVSLSAAGAAYVRLGLTAELASVVWQKMTAQTTFALPSASGDYTVYAQFATERGGMSKTIHAPMRLVYGPASSWVAVVAGTWHTCAIDVAGLLWCWGRNSAGELGVAAPASAAKPVRLPGDPWLQVSASYHTCGVRKDHSLWCWGSNNNEGQLGTGGAAATTPARVGAGADWKSVAAGQYHTCALKLDGSLWCWGQNAEGEVGIGVLGNQATPVRVGSANDWVHLDAKGSRACAVKSTGGLWCWGRNAVGQLGIGSYAAAWSPAQVTATTWKRVALSHNASCGLRADDTLWCWGLNTDGQLGLGAAGGSATTPQQLAGTWRDVSSGSDGYDGEHLCGVKAGGALACWGGNLYGELGTGDLAPAAAPATASAEPVWRAVTKGALHSCAVRTDGGLYCWGQSADGALGLGAVTTALTPRQVLR